MFVLSGLHASAQPQTAATDTVLSEQDSSIMAQLVTVVQLMKLEARRDSLRAELDALQTLQLEYRDNWALWPAVFAVLIVAIWSSRVFRRRRRGEPE